MDTNPSEGSVSLREYILGLLAERDRKYEQQFSAIANTFTVVNTDIRECARKDEIDIALTAMDRAVGKAEIAAEKRFDSVNEFRATLSDQQRDLMPRREVDILMNGINTRLDRMEGTIGERLVTMKERMDQITGERTGIKGGWGYAVGVIGFFMLLVSLARFFTIPGVD